MTFSKPRMVYDNPVTRAYRESDARRKVEADRLAPLREKHSKEVTLHSIAIALRAKH